MFYHNFMTRITLLSKKVFCVNFLKNCLSHHWTDWLQRKIVQFNTLMICEILSNYFQNWQVYWQNKKGISSIETQCRICSKIQGLTPIFDSNFKSIKDNNSFYLLTKKLFNRFAKKIRNKLCILVQIRKSVCFTIIIILVPSCGDIR